MAVSEPQETRTNRLFAQGLINRLRRARGELYPNDFPICVSLLQAGYAVAPESLKFEPFRELWSTGDSARAGRLAKVFTLAMVSRFLALPREGRPETDGAPNRLRHDWIDFILRLFGDFENESLEYYLGVDRQHQSDQSGESRHLRFLSDALYFAQALAALGREQAMRLLAPELPLTDYTQSGLAERGITFLTAGVHEALVEMITSNFYTTVMPRLDQEEL